MASRPSLRESLGLPIRVDAPAQKKKMSGLPGGGGRTSGVAPPNRRRTQVLAKGSRPSSSAVGPASHKRSSVYGHGGHSQPKKDPRPLSDRSFQISAVKKLIAFLLDKNYGKIYTPKQLQNPSTKEFLHIFNFLVTMIDPYLEVNGMTIVEDVPKTLKLLGYPFTVSKNHMLNVGSPHSWPILLGALAWLVDCCSLPDRTKELMFPSESGFDDGQPTPKEQEMLVEFYMYDVYLQYGHDSPEYQELLQQKAEADRQRLEELKEATVRVVDENEQLERATEELAQSSIPVLMAKKEENDQKLAALEETVERELPQAIARVVEEFNRLMADQSEIEMQTLAAEEKCKELEEMIRKQTMSAKDARELRMSISNAESDLEKHRLLQRDSMARVEELQIQHNRSVGLIDSACATVNNKLHRLSALLPDAASLSPLEYDTSRRADPEVLERLVSQARKLRQEVHTLHERVAARLSEVESKIISGESTLSTMQNELMRKQLENENLKHNLDIEKTELEQQKKKVEESMKTEQAEIHALQKHQRSLQQRLEEGPRTKLDLERAQQQFEDEVMRMAGELEEKEKEYEQCVISLTAVVEMAKRQKDEFAARVTELAEEFKDVTIPSVPLRYLRPDKSADNSSSGKSE